MRSLVLKTSFYLGLGLGLALSIGCSNESQITRQAPQAKKDLGFLVFGATKEQADHYLSDNPASQMRILSKTHQLYEFKYSDENKLKQHFPKAEIHKNVFINKNQELGPLEKVQRAFSNGNLEKIREILQSTQQRSLAVTGSDFDFKECKKSGLKPVLDIEPITTNLKRKKTLEVGDKIIIDGSKSQPHAFTGGDLKFSWMVSAPLGSKIKQRHSKARLKLELDTMGVYQILAVAQDKKGVCNIETAKVLVTGNQKYKAVHKQLSHEIANQSYLQKLGVKKAQNKAHVKGDGVIIAIIDSGVNYNHPFLSENIFTNPDEKDNGQDNDGNDLPADLHGWDFANNDPYPFDDNGHGSHVAGLSAAKVFGVAPNATILPVKVTTPAGVSDLGSSLQGILYALDMGASVINMSFGNYRPSVDIENQILKVSRQADAVLLAAAGNGNPSTGIGVNTDQTQHMPSGLVSDNLISVGALNEKNRLTYYSNYGAHSVQVATYGGEDFDVQTRKPYDGLIYSAYIPNPEGLLFHAAQGTSMATPIAAGITVLVRSLNPELSAAQVANIIRMSGPKAGALAGKVESGRVLTAKGAIDLTPTLDQLN